MSDISLPDLSVDGDDSGRPKYERLKDHLVGEMLSGRLKPGMALPSEQRLAETLKVARSTVRQAMAELERDGVISRVHGKGTFIHEQAYQRLRRGQDLFALIVPETQVGFYPALLRSFQESASGLHHQVIVCNTNNEVDRQGNTILQLIDHQVGGVAIVPTTSPPTPAFQIRQLQKGGTPVVFCSRRVDGIQAPLLAIPFEEVGRQAARAILKRGHRRIAYLGVSRSRGALKYEAGFRAEMEARGCDPAGLEVFYGASPTPNLAEHEEEITQAIDRICSRPDRPTAIFTSFDSLAELIFVLLGRRGFRIPEDISVVGFGGSKREGALLRRLTSVTVDEVRMGQQAIELLDRMRRGELPLDCDDVFEMPVGLNAGATLGPVGGAEETLAIASSLGGSNGQELGSDSQ